MKILNLTIGLFSLLCGFKTIAQDNFLINQYIFNQQIFNPATIGQDGDLGIFIYGDQNFNNTKGAPYSYLLTGHKSINDSALHLGVNFQQNLYGKEKTIYLLGDIAYNFSLDSTRTLSIGLKSGLFNYNNPLTEYDLYPDEEYDYAFANDINDNYLLVGLGVYYSSKNFIGGISSTNVSLIKLNDSDHKLKHNPSIYIFGGYDFKVKRKMILQPHILLYSKKDLPVIYRGTISLKYDKKLWLGASYDFHNSANIFARWMFKNGIGIGYGYKFLIYNSNPDFIDSHSLSLSYDLVTQ
ncbi:MAG: PorP/SprF family type IX secretion system membrane protein [bacterium]